MISLDLMKSSEVRKAGDRSNPCRFTNPKIYYDNRSQPSMIKTVFWQLHSRTKVLHSRPVFSAEGRLLLLSTYFEAESTKAPQSARRERVNELHHR